MHYKKILTAIIIFFVLSIPFFKKPEKQTVFTFWTVQLKAPVGDLIEKNIEEFKKLHPDIKVVWVDIPIAEAQKRTIASILGGNPPDLINLNPEYSVSLAQKKSLEFFDEKDVEDYNKGLVDKLRYEGKIYALPFYATSAVTVFNKKKFIGCNYRIRTYDDILKLKVCKNPPVFGIALNEGDSFAKILNKYNADNEEKLKEVYFKFKNINENGLLLKDTLTINHREAIEKYMAGSASYITAGSNFIYMIKQNAPDIYKVSKIEPQLTGDNGEYDVSLMNFVIPIKAKNKTLAKEFAKLLLNEENQMMFAKKTNVLPVNQKVLNDSYFKVCSNDLIDKARCISARQLNSPTKSDFGYKNKKEINETINNSLEELFLNGNFSASKTINKIKQLQKG